MLMKTSIEAPMKSASGTDVSDAPSSRPAPTSRAPLFADVL